LVVAGHPGRFVSRGGTAFNFNDPINVSVTEFGSATRVFGGLSLNKDREILDVQTARTPAWRTGGMRAQWGAPNRIVQQVQP